MCFSDPTTQDLHAAFVALLPRLQRYARFAFRSVRCPHEQADAAQELVALCWAWFVRLAARGKDAGVFPSRLADFAARQVRAGRKLCGQEAGKDGLSPTARWRRDFRVLRLDTEALRATTPWREALADNTRSPPDEAAAFRIDYPAWLSRLGERDRALAETMILAHSTAELARAFGLSPGRVSQLRQEFHDDWRRFHSKAVRPAKDRCDGCPDPFPRRRKPVCPTS
jgi:DNA-directed RNA polymerase specialized sigma24 family protein